MNDYMKLDGMVLIGHTMDKCLWNANDVLIIRLESPHHENLS